MYIDFPKLGTRFCQGRNMTLTPSHSVLVLMPHPLSRSGVRSRSLLPLSLEDTAASLQIQAIPIQPHHLYECCVELDIPETSYHSTYFTIVISSDSWTGPEHKLTPFNSNLTFRFYSPSKWLTLTLVLHCQIKKQLPPFHLALSSLSLTVCSPTLYTKHLLWNYQPVKYQYQSVFSHFHDAIWCLSHLSSLHHWFLFREQSRRLGIHVKHLYHMAASISPLSLRFRPLFASFLASQERARASYTCLLLNTTFITNFEQHAYRVFHHLPVNTDVIIWGHNGTHEWANPYFRVLHQHQKSTPVYPAVNDELSPCAVSLSLAALKTFRTLWVGEVSQTETKSNTAATFLQLWTRILRQVIQKHTSFICRPSLFKPIEGHSPRILPPKGITWVSKRESMPIISRSSQHLQVECATESLRRLITKTVVADQEQNVYLKPADFWTPETHISIVTIVRQPGELLQRVLESLLQQTFSNFTIYLLPFTQACSEKQTREMSQQLSYYNHMYSKIKLHSGTLYDTLKTFHKSSYLTICDNCTAWHPHKLAMQMYGVQTGADIALYDVHPQQAEYDRYALTLVKIEDQLEQLHATGLFTLPLNTSLLQPYHNVDQLLFYLCKAKLEEKAKIVILHQFSEPKKNA